MASHRDPAVCTRVQDAYSLRCSPQVIGAARDTLEHATTVANRELAAAVDNPVVTLDGRVESNGNFHGAPVAYVLDFLAIVIADVASMSERRTDRFLDVARNHGLPPFLADDPGTDSGLMIAQYTAAGIVSELKRLASPASVDSIPSSAMQEDHVSMGWAAGRKLLRAIDGLARGRTTITIAHRLSTAERADRVLVFDRGRLVEQGTHFVRWGAVQPDTPGVSIGCDNTQGGHDITAHLVAQGRRRIAFLGHASNHYPEFFERYLGHRQALETAGLSADPALQVDALTTEQSGHDAATELLARGAPFDAIFAASDLIAVGAMKALLERGLRVPDDVAVAGFDDIPLASFVNPGLSTVQQDTKRAGALLVETLLALIHGEPAESQTIPVKLALRGSTAAK